MPHTKGKRRDRAATFVYRCPQLDLNVQGFVAEEMGENDLKSLTCLECARVHLVNPTSAKVVGDE
jgi:hypothetical protein